MEEIQFDIDILKEYIEKPQLTTEDKDFLRTFFVKIEDEKLLREVRKSFNYGTVTEEKRNEMKEREKGDLEKMFSAMFGDIDVLPEIDTGIGYDEIVLSLRKENELDNTVFKVSQSVLEIFTSTGLIDLFKGKRVKFIVEDFEKMSDDMIQNIVDSENSILEIFSFKGFNKEIIEKLSENPELNYSIEGDSYIDEYENRYYSLQQIKDVEEFMSTIKEMIPEGSTELEKVLTYYKYIQVLATYDYSGCVETEEHIKGNEILTRSLLGTLLNGMTVCAGDALAFKYCMDYIGIDSKEVSGWAINSDGTVAGNHAWNQVKVDDKWYNIDLTFDRKREQKKYCLKNDEEFGKSHRTSRKIEKCDENYPEEAIAQTLEKIQSGFSEEILQLIESRKEHKVTMEDFKENAYSRPINLEIISKIKTAIEQRDKLNEQEHSIEE